MDLQLSPLGLVAIERLAPQFGEKIVDVGCGAGQSIIQLAERVGPSGFVTGVDIAPELLEAARRRTSSLDNVKLVECDAAAVDLGDRDTDCVFSRFGVMAFSDPVAAFQNFRRMTRSGGRLGFVCWRSFSENDLDSFPIRVTGLEGEVDQTPFSFSEPDRIRATLSEAGYREVSIEAHDELVSSGGMEEMVTVLLSVGALGKVVRENPGTRPAAEQRLRESLQAIGDGSSIALKAATWIVTAKA